MTKLTDGELSDLFMVALFSGCEPCRNLLTGFDRGTFRMRYEPQPEFTRLLQANQQRLAALLKGAMLAVDWGFGAKFATFRVIPVGEKTSSEPFEVFTLPIPSSDKPYAIMQ
jgi:hypothetical protein